MSARGWMAVVLALPLAASGGEGPKAEEGTVVNSIVAVVNNEPVTQLEVEALVASSYAMPRARRPTSSARRATAHARRSSSSGCWCRRPADATWRWTPRR